MSYETNKNEIGSELSSVQIQEMKKRRENSGDGK